MASRRRIREAAVQFLYGFGLDDDAPPSEADRRERWEFIAESERRTMQVAALRTLTHLSQGRRERVEDFVARMGPAMARLAAYPEAAALRDDLVGIAEMEQSWTTIADLLAIQETGDPDKAAVAKRIETRLAELFKLNRELSVRRRRYFEALEDFPGLRGPLEPLSASIRRLQKLAERLSVIEEPEKHPEHPQLGKLREASADLSGLLDRAGDLVSAVMAHRGELDGILASVSQNFSPDRIDAVDRAVLRLATYELGHTATPVKVIINEAVELARRFGGTDSHRFVNGLLDAAARRLRE